MTTLLGVDIGGTGIKAAPVDIDSGALTAARRALATPRPADPEAVAAAVAELIVDLDPGGPIGVGFPGVIRRGVVHTAANLEPSWIGLEAAALFARNLGERPMVVLNDADAAGLAETRFGAGAAIPGVVVTVTLGTGIGTAVFNNGVLLPNTEFGHLVVDGAQAEDLASARAKQRESATWRHWAGHLQDFLTALERLVWPDLFIIGGGISAEFHRFCSHLHTDTPLRVAALGNDAGIVGAALAARGEA